MKKLLAKFLSTIAKEILLLVINELQEWLEENFKDEKESTKVS